MKKCEFKKDELVCLGFVYINKYHGDGFHGTNKFYKYFDSN